ncbi:MULTISPECIES: YfjI family protein [Enterobacterales]|uniref:YfjI family protein n=1 Tax=Enterobacterales TaxID=91347 RepID=UPI002ED797FA
MFNEIALPEYPIEHFPIFVRQTIEELQKSSQAPVEMVADVVLGAISLACQSLAMIEHRDGRISPLSLFLCIIALSGERKSGVYNEVIRPFLLFEKKVKEEYILQREAYEAELAAWKAIEKAILKKIGKFTEKKLDTTELKETLKFHYTQKSVAPRLPKLIYTDATPDAVLKGLSVNIATAGLMLDEGGIFFKGHGHRNLPVYNQAWDGVSLEVDRKDHTLVIDNCRFTMLLMIQPDELKAYLKRYGNHAFGSGFFPRFLITGVNSMQGKRDNTQPKNVNREIIDKFYHRITEQLEQMLKNDKPRGLTLSRDAQEYLAGFQNRLESRMVTDTNLHTALPSILSKAPENVVRIAGLFHQFSGYESNEVDVSLIKSAIQIVSYHYQQVINLLVCGCGSSDDDAEVLYGWLISGPFHNSIQVARPMIRRYAPSHLRDRYRLYKALAVLEEDGRVRIYDHKNSNGTTTVMVQIFR